MFTTSLTYPFGIEFAGPIVSAHVKIYTRFITPGVTFIT